MKIFIYDSGACLKNYVNALTRINCEVVLTKDLAKSFDCDALLLTGGSDVCPELYGESSSLCEGVSLENDKSEIFLIKVFLASNKKIIGVCRGMQMLNVYFGGTLNKDIKGHRLDGYHTISAVKNGFLSKNFGEFLNVNSSHHQSVLTLADNFEVDAVCTFDKTVEAIKHKFLPIYGVQFHPERMEKEFSDKLFSKLFLG